MTINIFTFLLFCLALRNLYFFHIFTMSAFSNIIIVLNSIYSKILCNYILCLLFLKLYFYFLIENYWKTAKKINKNKREVLKISWINQKALQKKFLFNFLIILSISWKQVLPRAFLYAQHIYRVLMNYLYNLHILLYPLELRFINHFFACERNIIKDCSFSNSFSFVF